MISWVIIALVFFFGSSFIATNYFKNAEAVSALKIFAFFFLGINLFQIINTFFMSVQNTFYEKMAEFIRILFVLLSILAMMLLDLKTLENFSYAWIIWLYIWILFSGFLFFKSYFFRYLINKKILWDKKLFLKLFKYCLIVLLWAQASTLLSQMDMQMVIYILWTKEAWYYTNYLSIVMIPVLIIWPIFYLLFPVFSELHAKKRYDEIRNIKTFLLKNFYSYIYSFQCFIVCFCWNHSLCIVLRKIYKILNYLAILHLVF